MFAAKTGPTLLAIEHNVSAVEKIVGEVQVQVKSPLVQLKCPQEGVLEGVQDVVRQKAQEKPLQVQVQVKSPQEGALEGVLEGVLERVLEGVQDVVRQKAQEKPPQVQVQNEVQVKPSQEVLHEEDQEGDSVPMEGYQSENEHRSAKEKIEELKAALP